MRGSWWTGYGKMLVGLTIAYSLVASGLVEPSWGTVIGTGVVAIGALMIGLWREENRGDDE